MNLLYTLISIACLIFGFYSGYKIGKEQRLPEVKINPVKAIEKHKKNKKDKKIEKETQEKLKELEEDLKTIDEFNADI